MRARPNFPALLLAFLTGYVSLPSEAFAALGARAASGARRGALPVLVSMRALASVPSFPKGTLALPATLKTLPRAPANSTVVSGRAAHSPAPSAELLAVQRARAASAGRGNIFPASAKSFPPAGVREEGISGLSRIAERSGAMVRDMASVHPNGIRAAASSALGAFYDGMRLGGVREGADVLGRSGTLGSVPARMERAPDLDPRVPAAPVPTPSGSPASNPKKGVWFILSLAGLGVAGAYFAAPALGPWLGLDLSTGWGLRLAMTGGALIGVSASQGATWRVFFKEMFSGAKESARFAFRFWARFGLVFASVLRGSSPDAAMKGDLPLSLFKYSPFAWPFVLLGYGAAPVLMGSASVVLGTPLLSWWGAATLLFGGAPAALSLGVLYVALETPVLSVYRGLRQIALGFMPWLGRVLSNLLPFLAGWVGGWALGLLGSALGGAVFLGRPYFQYILSRRVQGGSLPRILGRALLKLAVLLLGLVFGAIGLALGVVIALPVALTLAPAVAFRWARIGGRAQRFWDLWLSGNLLQELRRVNLLTRFQFEEKGALPLGDAWARLAQIVPAVLAATPAGVVAGWTGYVRGLRGAWRDLRSGKMPVAPQGDVREEFKEVFRESARFGAGTGASIANFTALAAALIGLFKSVFGDWPLLLGLGRTVLLVVVGWIGVFLIITLASIVLHSLWWFLERAADWVALANEEPIKK